MLSIYIVSSWVLIQVLAVTWEPLGIPQKSVTFLIIALLIGFPIYLFYIWKIRLEPLEKLKKARISKKGKPKKSGFQKMYFSVISVISLISLVAVAFILENNFFKSVKLPAQFSTDKIAILKFGNNTGDSKNDIVGKMTSDWIMHGITQNQLGQVVSPEIVTEYVGFLGGSAGLSDDRGVLDTYFKPAKVITGNYYLDNDKLIFQCSITDGDYNETFISFEPISCDMENPLECIESLKQLILGYLITEDSPELNLQDTPPKFEAYRYFIDAKANISDSDAYIALLNKAVAADSNYFEAKVDRVVYYYNAGQYSIADSLIGTIQPNSRNTRQINLLDMYKALLDGNNKKIYTHIMKEYNYAPFHLETSVGVMVVSLQYVNRPQDIDSIFKMIPMKGMDVGNCTQCQFRYYVEGLAEVERKEYGKAIRTLTPIANIVNDFYLKRPLIAAHIRSNNFPGVDSLFSKLSLTNSENDLKNGYLFAGKECLMSDNEKKAIFYFDKIISIEEEAEDKYYSAFALYYKGAYNETEPLLKLQLEEDPDSKTLLALLAVTYFKNGKETEAESMLSELEELRAEYQFGSIDYALAQYYAATGSQERSFQYLLQSVAAGNNYTPQTFQNDPHFKDYRDSDIFKNIMTFWH
ncbi:MAG: tetratricopeptide repeat protein [Bacteroidetes bacterium]|nr:tetratricopeptide repeat protein [Bacteroidota bacterium]